MVVFYSDQIRLQTNLSVNTVFGREGFLVGGEVAYNGKDAKVRKREIFRFFLAVK